LRISVPDRPGTLGLVASAIGRAGADVVGVEVLESERGRALDDLHVSVTDGAHLLRVRQALEQVLGVAVVGAQHPAPPVTGHAELELVASLVARPDRVLDSLVDGAPAAVGADWAALLAYDAAGSAGAVLRVSPTCPGEQHVVLRTPLRLGSPVMTGRGAGEPFGGTALVPLPPHDLGLVLVRTGGPTFSRSELWRLGEIGKVAGSVLSPAGEVVASRL
jgi:hypothetical protein